MNEAATSRSPAAVTVATAVASDPLIGREVEIHSVSGIPYHGVVVRIEDRGDLGELFELGSVTDPSYHRLVYVVDRPAQIRWTADG